jgi:hypothetical protein
MYRIFVARILERLNSIWTANNFGQGTPQGPSRSFNQVIDGTQNGLEQLGGPNCSFVLNLAIIYSVIYKKGGRRTDVEFDTLLAMVFNIRIVSTPVTVITELLLIFLFPRQVLASVLFSLAVVPALAQTDIQCLKGHWQHWRLYSVYRRILRACYQGKCELIVIASTCLYHSFGISDGRSRVPGAFFECYDGFESTCMSCPYFENYFGDLKKYFDAPFCSGHY